MKEMILSMIIVKEAKNKGKVVHRVWSKNVAMIRKRYLTSTMI